MPIDPTTDDGHQARISSAIEQLDKIDALAERNTATQRQLLKESGQAIISLGMAHSWMIQCQLHLAMIAQLEELVGAPSAPSFDLTHRMHKIVDCGREEANQVIFATVDEIRALGRQARGRAQAALSQANTAKARNETKGKVIGCLILLVLAVVFCPGIRFLLSIPFVVVVMFLESLFKALGIGG